MNTAPEIILSERQRIASLLAIFASVFTWGISFAGLIPLMSLSMESRGVDTLMIGIVGAATPVGVIVAAPTVSAIIRQFGTAMSILLASIGVLITVALLPVFDSLASWLMLRFVAGMCGAVPWVGTEIWLNSIANERSRGRVTALYGAVMAASFAAGPIVLTIVGVQGNIGYFLSAGMMAVSLIPLLFIWNLAPVLHLPHGIRYAQFITAIPSLLAAAMLCGMVDMAFFSFLPIWGLRSGFDEHTAILLLSIFVLGNVVLQFPIGWLADHTNRRMILLACGAVGIVGPIGVSIFSQFPITTGIIFFFWGGCAWALYTIALAMLGERYKGGMLTAASAAFVIAYEISNVVGPPIAGIAIEIWEPHGLMALMSIVSLLFCILVGVRGLRRKDTD